jgi:hypothetical protein
MQALRAKGNEGGGMDKKEDFQKCGVGVRFFEPNGLHMRWRTVLKCEFEMFPAWLNKPNQYKIT